MNNCDIIIPIYNAYDCLKPCIDSVINNTDLKNNRIILIDDKSSDDRVLPLLETYQNEKNIILLKNDNNLGFVGTVNRGMKYSNNDVLLLNSDTEVTSNWLNKIKKCAYSNDRIATVTPLSNNATLASVPKSFYPNDLPYNISLDEMSKFVEKASNCDYIEIPSGHGFCLYIKRTALDVVGLFDEETYGRGYGEENDFCFRCIDNGMINALCTNTYILHKESQSFSMEKTKLIEDGLKQLSNKYPNSKTKLDEWCARNEISYIGNNISIEIGIESKKPNVLIVIHDWNNITDNLGGTTLHVWDIIRNLRDDFNFHVLAPSNGYFKVYSYWSNGHAESIANYPHVFQFTEFSNYNKEYRNMVNEIIDKYSISIAHIHHLKEQYFDVIDILKEKNIYTILTIHDYYPICPLINKLYKNVEYCDDASTKKCEKCLSVNKISSERAKAIIRDWRITWEKYLKKVDYILTPSKSSKDEILMTYNNIKVDVIEHGIDVSEESVNPDNNQKNVAFVGAIGIHKGSIILRKLIKKSCKGFKIHLFGKLDIPVKNNKNYIDHGIYKRDELSYKLKKNNISLICLFSIWPETYSYTLQESIASGIPVISFDFGAVAERIEKYNLGWTISRKSSINEICKKINEILSNTEEYRKKVESIKKYHIKTTKEMSNEYKKIYNLNLNEKYLNKVDKKYLCDNSVNSTKDYGKFIYSNYSWILDTLKWKIISKIKVPQFIKSIVWRIKHRND